MLGKWMLGGALAALVPVCAAAAPMLGFSAPNADAERALEAKFDANLSAVEIDARLKRLAAAPNQVGSPHDKANAEWVLAQLQELGLGRPHRDLPGALSDADRRIAGAGRAGAVQGHASTSRRSPATPPRRCKTGALPPYLIYGADGDVTADLVYVNYGTPDDYKALARLGVDVKGKIVIARYGADLARAEGEARRRARRGRLHHLFRPRRRRLRPGRRLSEGRLAAGRRRPARLGPRYAGPHRRSADARTSAPRRTPSGCRSARPRR